MKARHATWEQLVEAAANNPDADWKSNADRSELADQIARSRASKKKPAAASRQDEPGPEARRWGECCERC